MEKADFSCQLKSGPKSLQLCDTGAVREVISLTGALYLLEVWCRFHVGGVSSFIYLCQVPRSVPGVWLFITYSPAIVSWCEVHSALFLGCYGSLNVGPCFRLSLNLGVIFAQRYRIKGISLEPLMHSNNQLSQGIFFFFTKRLIGP